MITICKRMRYCQPLFLYVRSEKRKKIISLILVSIIGIGIIPKTLVNEKHEVLESSISVYTKEEVDSMLAALNNNITVNTNEIISLKNEITALNDSLTNYALKSDLSTTNSNIDDLNTIVANNTNRIEILENNSTRNMEEFSLKSNATANISWDSTQKATVITSYTPTQDCYFICHGYTSNHSSNYLSDSSSSMPGIRILELKGPGDSDTITDYVNIGTVKSGEEITCDFYAYTSTSYITINIDILTDEK